MIGLVKGGDYDTPTVLTSSYTNVGIFYDWILQNANDIYADAIQGPDVVCSTATFTISPLPSNAEIELS